MAINFRIPLKYVTGAVAATLMPWLTREMDQNQNTSHALKLKRAIHYYRTRQMRARGDTANLQSSLTAFWAGEAGDSFHASYIDHRVALFTSTHAQIIDEAARQVEAIARFHRLVEIGCGGGEVLAYTAQKIHGLTKVVGLDINASAIARARDKYTDREDLTFEVAELGAWLDRHSEQGTVLLSYGGVFEYLSQQSVEGLLECLVAKPSAMVILVEPVAPDHDLEQTVESFAFGVENSFSHNHAYLLKNAGFRISYSKIVDHENVRWMMMIAIVDPDIQHQVDA